MSNETGQVLSGQLRPFSTMPDDLFNFRLCRSEDETFLELAFSEVSKAQGLGMIIGDQYQATTSDPEELRRLSRTFARLADELAEYTTQEVIPYYG